MRNSMLRTSLRDESLKDRFMMRPSIARMTLDLNYGEMPIEEPNGGGKQGTQRVTEALQHRLVELLVFEIRQDGNTEFKNLSVRGLYKYVLKSIKVPADKRLALRGMQDASLKNVHQLRQTKLLKKQQVKRKDKHGDNNNNMDYDDDNNSNINDSDSSSTTSRDDDNDNNKHKDLLGGKRSSQTKSCGSASNSVDGKSVSFGGPQGPFVTEHPPKIPGVPIAQEEEHRNSLAGAAVGGGGGGGGQPDDPMDDLTEDRFNHYPVTVSPGPVTYRERLGGFLHPRDMRRLVTPFSASNEPELIVRRHVMLLNFDPLRAVILRDRLLVLVPDGADSLLVDIEKRVRGGSREIERSIFGETAGPNHAESSNLGDSQHSFTNLSVAGSEREKTSTTTITKRKSPRSSIIETIGKVKNSIMSENKKTPYEKNHSSVSYDNDNESTADTNLDIGSEFQEWEEMDSRDWIDLPFELQCLDAVLGSVCSILGKDSTELQTNSIKAMDMLLQQGPGQGEEILRHMKNSVKEMTSRVKGFIRAMNLVMDETEDMALMNLTRLLTHPERFIQPVSEDILNEESDEPELILEAHLQQAFSLTNSLDLVRGEIQTTQELINQRLDAVRNRLLLANMIISVGSFCVAVGSFIGSIMGMNVTNHIETDPNAFKQIVMGTCMGMFGLVMMFGLVLWYAGTLPNLRSSF